MDFLAEHIYVGIRKGQTLKLEQEHSIILCDVPIDTREGNSLYQIDSNASSSFCGE
jgi:hypothetical protein